MEYSISLESLALDIKYHPKAPILASSHVDGTLQFHQFNEDSKEYITISKHQCHSQSLRSFDFSEDGQYILSVSKDNTINISKDAKVIHSIEYTKKKSDMSLSCIKRIDAHTFATGDEEGRVKLWDMNRKTNSPVHKFGDQEDMISAFELTSDGNYLLSTSIDGSLAVFDLRKPDVFAQSQCFNEDILSLSIVKSGSFVCCGTQEGIIYLFKWGKFNDAADRIICGDSSVDSIVTLNQDEILVGGFDGIVRVVGIYPNKVLRVVNNDKEMQSSIMKMCISADKKCVAESKMDFNISINNLEEVLEEEECKMVEEVKGDFFSGFKD